ncbi:MAG: formylglycine-generating enzyme family protein [Halothiobacillaceae bacterium]
MSAQPETIDRDTSGSIGRGEDQHFTRASFMQAEAARAKGFERLFADRLDDGSTGPQLAFIPAGAFEMGAPPDEYMRLPEEGPRREVRFSAPYAMTCTAMTRAWYYRFVEESGRRPPRPYTWREPGFPVYNVSFWDAEAFANWLSGRTGQRYRLPTEGEWEYAARAGTDSAFCFGDKIHREEVNCAGGFQCTRGLFLCGLGKPVAAGSLPANGWGLHEVHGNVQEWTQDHWSDTLRGHPTEGGNAHVSLDKRHRQQRVVRGGSWFDRPGRCRSASRAARYVYEFDLNLGFRLVREID